MHETMGGLSMNLEQTNMDKLLFLCDEYISNDFEKYKFEWKGKAECLRLAANLLRDDGVIFISIDDAELYTIPPVRSGRDVAQ